MSAGVVKPEIKVDSLDEKKLEDIEAFEDDNDLKFPDHNEKAWLVKLPGYLWEKWNALYAEQKDNERLRVGSLRVYDPIPGQSQKVEILLDTSIEEQKKLPAKYELNITATEYNNTVVFSEKDIPGYRPRNRNRHNQGGKPTGIPNKFDRYADKVGYKSAIPKQTALAPIITNEGKAIPIEDGDYEGFMHDLWASTMKQKTSLNAPAPDRSRHTTYGTVAAFSTTSRPNGKNTQKKPVKEKAVRMERGALIEAILSCFRKYKYWGLKALRNELKQPEAWIKELLEDMAILIKSGDFAMNYKLNASYLAMNEEETGGVDDAREEVAKVETASDMSSGDDMDDGEDFEDVKMEGTG